MPKRAIEDICKIDIQKDAFLTRAHIKDNEQALFSHMFEIYLREDYEDLYYFREEEQKAMEEVRKSRYGTPRTISRRDSFSSNLEKSLLAIN